MSNVAFLDETEVCERAVRRLARSRGVQVNLNNGVWNYAGVELDGDDLWAVLSALPVASTTRYGLL